VLATRFVVLSDVQLKSLKETLLNVIHMGASVVVGDKAFAIDPIKQLKCVTQNKDLQRFI
jgi:hypothetical protein